MVCTAAFDQFAPRIASDGAGGAIVAWTDYRNDPYGNPSVFAQRVGVSGDLLWGESGLSLGLATGLLQIASDDAGGAVVGGQTASYEQGNLLYRVVAQRVDAFGAVQWGAGGAVLCAATGVVQEIRLVANGAHGAIAS